MEKTITMSEFESIVEKMKKCVMQYENMDLKSNYYNMCLANGDYLNLRMLPNNIPHLLGFNVDYFRSLGYVNANKSAYDVLKYFLENITYISLKTKYSVEAISQLFSDYIDNKLDSFSLNTQIKPDSIYFMVKYVSERAYMSEELLEKSDYYIIKKNNDNYYVLGLVKVDNTDNDYLPMTSRMYSDSESFDEFMKKICKNQEITYLYKSTVKNYTADFTGNYRIVSDKRKELLDRVYKLAMKYSAVATTSKDYILSLNSTSSGFQRVDNNMTALKLLTDAIKTNNVLSRDEVTEVIEDARISDDVWDLINACNDMICSRDSISQGAKDSYSSIQEENNRLKEELSELEELKNELASCKEQLINIQAENDNYKSKFEVLNSAFEKVKTM